MKKAKPLGMDVLTAIMTRRSVRRYTSEPVTDEDIHTLLRAGFYAPSAVDGRPWEFIAVRDRSVLDGLADNSHHMKMLHEAPAAIVVCGNQKRMPVHDLLMNDCSAAAENILLAAHGIGLGAVWCGIIQEIMIRRFREVFALPEHVLPVALIALGHPAETMTVKERYDPEHVHDGKFHEAGQALPEQQKSEKI